MEDIHITPSDLRNPRVDDVIAMESALQTDTEGTFIDDAERPFFFNPMFYYSVSTALMAFIAWVIIEPYFSDVESSDNTNFAGVLLFMLTAAMIGLGLGTVYGLVNRNIGQAAYCGSVGFGVGFLAGIPGTILAGIVFAIGKTFSEAFINGPIETIEDYPPMAFFILICTRSTAWSIVASAAGLPLGIALKSKKLVSVGVIGGIIGGAMGGLFFDPVDRFISTNSVEAWLSRMVGLTAVGFLTGLFIGYIENLSRTAWLQMLRGPLTGKHFNLFKSPMIIGSTPKSDVYLFKDADISPEHASITISGSKFLLKDLNSQSGVFVNGNRINQAVLQKGDVVTLGKTVLKYDDQEKRV